MQILILFWNGKRYTLTFRKSDTVRTIKKKIEEKENIDIRLQRIHYGGKILKNYEVIRDCLKDTAVIHCMYHIINDQ